MTGETQSPWAFLTDDQLGEIFDALFERHERIIENAQQVICRRRLTGVRESFVNQKYTLAAIHTELIDSLSDEIRIRDTRDGKY